MDAAMKTTMLMINSVTAVAGSTMTTVGMRLVLR